MTNKTFTVITGASSGIGYAAAKAFAKRDKNLVLIARREEQLTHLRKEINQIKPNLEIILKVADLSHVENLDSLFVELENLNIETWINNAGVGLYSRLAEQDPVTTLKMLRLNIEAVTLFSLFFTKKYKDVPNTQLINISSAGGYTIVPTAITYCGTKFFVSSFTEGLAYELIENGALLRAKVLAPAATQTEFGRIANQVETYDYDQEFGAYHSSEEIAEFLMTLYDSDKIVGHVNREKFTFELSDGRLAYAGNATFRQSLTKDKG